MDNQTPDPYSYSSWHGPASSAAGLYGELPALPTRGPVRTEPVREPEQATIPTDRDVAPDLRG